MKKPTRPVFAGRIGGGRKNGGAMPADKSAEKPLCFVIGPIGKIGSPERKHADFLLRMVLKPVLEAEGFGYLVKRADEDADPGMIGNRMIIDIIRAELVIADLTGLNANAFYELGIRHATGKPTIHIADAGTGLPFDTISHRTIFIDSTDVDSIEQGQKSIAASARAIKEPDFRVSNPITQANASFEMHESSDPRDRVLAEIQARLARIEARTDESGIGGEIDIDKMRESLRDLPEHQREQVIWAVRSGQESRRRARTGRRADTEYDR